MTRSPRDDGPRAARPPSGRDPYGLLPGGTPIAAVVSVIGLFVVALVTMALVSGNVPFAGGPAGGNAGPGATDDPKVLKTPTPSNLVIVPTEEPGLVVPGTIVYAKDGNIWLQADGTAAQLTSSGLDSMPSFSSDGATVIFVRTRVVNGRWGVDGVARRYHLEVPSVMSIPTAGGSATRLYDGLVDPAGSLKWMGFIQNPVLSPDGRTIAMTTDLPDPTRSDVTLKLLNPKNDRIKDLRPRPAVAPRPPGPGVAAGRQEARLRPRRPRRRAGNVAHLRLRPGHGQGSSAVGAGLPPPGVVAQRTLPRRHEGDLVRDRRRHPRRVERVRGPARHERRRQLGPRLVAGGRPARLPARLGPGRGPAARPARWLGAVVDRRRPGEPHDERGARQRVAAALVRAGGPDAGRDAGAVDGPRIRAGRVARRIVTASYLERLAARTSATGSVLCVGLDPDPASLPAGFSATLAGVEAFARLVLEASLPSAAAIKPNLAFFEAHGSAGMAALERLRRLVPGDVPFVADAKRGDIGSTAASHAIALYDALGADAVTVNPYLGEEAIAPLLERVDRFAYVLCRTSNRGAAEVQGLVVAADPAAGLPAEPLWARIARRATAWGPGGTVGLVVGATAPDELRAIRALVPGLAFLVPGVGAQGGEVGPVLADGPAAAAPAGGRPGGGLLVNVSRGIARAALGEPPDGASPDPGERLAQAARTWASRLAVLP